jgi:hypothetical protein
VFRFAIHRFVRICRHRVRRTSSPESPQKTRIPRARARRLGLVAVGGAYWVLSVSAAVAQLATLSDDPPSAQVAPTGQTENQWRPVSPAGSSRTSASGTVTNATNSATTEPALEEHRIRTARAAVPIRSGGKDMLPNDDGQVWRQYDISSYTQRVKDVERPEQAIVDWILRETGTEVWFAQPLGLLNADRSTLSVYHTPQMQEVVADVVGKFVNGTLEPQVLNLRVVAINSPNWRTAMTRFLQPVDVQTVGVEAWLMSKENAAVLLADLRRRSDFREHASSQMVFFNGQPTSVTQLRPRTYVRSYRARQSGWMGHEPEMAQLQEGFSLQISPLVAADERSVDAVLECHIDQVEQLVAVPIDLPGMNGQIQRAEIQVPQLVSWRLHDRFRWPTDQVLLLSCGVVASPGPSRATTFGIPNPFISRPGRSDALLFVECKGEAARADVAGSTAAGGSAPVSNRGRY